MLNSPERVPDPVLNLGLLWLFDCDSLLSVNCLSGNKVEGDKGVLFAASNEHSVVSVGLNNNGLKQKEDGNVNIRK